MYTFFSCYSENKVNNLSTYYTNLITFSCQFRFNKQQFQFLKYYKKYIMK
jgi:hypothetical protein